MTKILFIRFGAVLFGFLFLMGILFLFGAEKASPFQLSVIKVNNGWGYDISRNGRPYIHQTVIPVIEKSIPFPTKELAKATGELVLDKLSRHELPALKYNELKTLGLKDELTIK